MKLGHITATASRNALRRSRLALAGVATLLATGSCDIVQGFQDAGDALFPPQKTYIETPGFRLAEGDFRRLNVGVGDELYLLVRSAEDSDPTLYSMRYVDPKPCRITGVGRYWSSGLPTDYPAQILYLAGDERRGQMHFADARCRVHDLVLEDTEFPIDESALGLLMVSGPDLVLVDPPTNHVRTVATGIQALLLNGPGAHFIISGGKLDAYNQSNWDYIGSAGEDVVNVRGVGGFFLYEDSTGVHALTVVNAGGERAVAITSIDPDGCDLGWVSGSMVAYHSPCAEQRLAIWDAATSRTTPIDFDADPSYLLTTFDPKRDVLNPHFPDDYWFFTLRDVTANSTGTLVGKGPEGEELVIGTGARLERTTIDSSGDYGLAMLDVVDPTGRLVRWQRDGSVETLAESVLMGSSDLIVNWNGVVGDRARLTDAGDVEILLRHVPSRDYDYQDAQRRWRAIFDDSDGITGTLSIDSSGSHTFAGKHVIAHNVRHPRHEFLDVVLPGIAYVSNYEAETDTGRLEYNNLELGFRGIVSEGVSDFIPAGNGILYTVPFGRARGVWLARAE